PPPLPPPSTPPPPSPPPPPPPSLSLAHEEEELGEKLLHELEDDRELLWRASMVPQVTEYPFELQIVEWANISMIDAERRLLASALLDYSNEKFILLSEACIPLYNFTTIYDYLIIKNNLSFVGVEPDPKKASPYRFRGKMDPPLKRWQWQKGAQWVVMDRVLSVDIISDTSYYPVFRDHCSWPCQNQDEHYVQILVMLYHPERNSNWSLTWTEWKGNRHPTMFGPRSNISVDLVHRLRFRDNCTIAGQFTNMCYLFARKFAPHSIKQLLEVSSTLFG
ncbi:hypothetical protein RDABS01_011209, partial [Bienertia sinuspersici]